MTEAEARQAACAKYEIKYPNDTDVEATEYIENAFAGSLVSIRAVEQNGGTTEEVVYISKSGEVKLFNTTEELVRFLQLRCNYPPPCAGWVSLIPS